MPTPSPQAVPSTTYPSTQRSPPEPTIPTSKQVPHHDIQQSNIRRSSSTSLYSPPTTNPPIHVTPVLAPSKHPPKVAIAGQSSIYSLHRVPFLHCTVLYVRQQIKQHHKQIPLAKRGSVTFASSRLRECSQRLVLGRVNMHKRGGLLTTQILIVNTNNLKSPTTVCLTTTNINAVNVISSSIISLSGLRHRVVRNANGINVPGIRSTTRAIASVGPSIAIGPCRVHMSTNGVTRLVTNCSIVISTTSGFSAGFLVGSTYILTKGPCVCNNTLQFRNRLVACIPKQNPYCHYVFHSVPTTNRIPDYGRTNILNTIIKIVNDVRTIRTIGLVLNINGPLATQLVAFSTLTVAYHTIPLPRHRPSYPIYNRRPAVAALSPTQCVRPTYNI